MRRSKLRVDVAAYVGYVHFVEAVHGIISGTAPHGEAEGKAEGHD